MGTGIAATSGELIERLARHRRLANVPRGELQWLAAISAHATADMVEVSIVDQGRGIPDAIVGRIFDPFFTTKPVGQGRGLGLNLVRRVVQLVGGRIDVESRPGKTEFCVALPIA